MALRAATVYSGSAMDLWDFPLLGFSDVINELDRCSNVVDDLCVKATAQPDDLACAAQAAAAIEDTLLRRVPHPAPCTEPLLQCPWSRCLLLKRADESEERANAVTVRRRQREVLRVLDVLTDMYLRSASVLKSAGSRATLLQRMAIIGALVTCMADATCAVPVGPLPRKRQGVLDLWSTAPLQCTDARTGVGTVPAAAASDSVDGSTGDGSSADASDESGDEPSDAASTGVGGAASRDAGDATIARTPPRFMLPVVSLTGSTLGDVGMDMVADPLMERARACALDYSAAKLATDARPVLGETTFSASDLTAAEHEAHQLALACGAEAVAASGADGFLVLGFSMLEHFPARFSERVPCATQVTAKTLVKHVFNKGAGAYIATIAMLAKVRYHARGMRFRLVCVPVA